RRQDAYFYRIMVILPRGRGHRRAPGRRRLRALKDAHDHVADGGDVAVVAPDHVGDQAGPPGLVRGAEPGAVVTVGVLAEDEIVPPGPVVLQPLGLAEAGAPPSGSRVKMEVSRSCRSAAALSRVSCMPDPVGYSIVRSSPKNR